MKTAYTPGPWRIGEDDVIVAGPRGLHIAKVEITGMGYAADANSRLIAAAPEMLDALQALETMALRTAKAFPNAPGVGDWNQAALVARAAIAKATNA